MSANGPAVFITKIKRRGGMVVGYSYLNGTYNNSIVSERAYRGSRKEMVAEIKIYKHCSFETVPVHTGTATVSRILLEGVPVVPPHHIRVPTFFVI